VYLCPVTMVKLVDITNGLNKYVYALSARPATDSFILFAGTSFGMFMSVDSGKSWTADGLKDTIVLSLAVNDSCLFAGTSQVSFAGTERQTVILVEFFPQRIRERVGIPVDYHITIYFLLHTLMVIL